MARGLQTLVLARDRVVAPVFSSIEEYLGRNTAAYYRVLEEVGAGAWHPQRDARPWLHFCLRAHFFQANTTMRRRMEIEQVWVGCADLAAARGLPERCAAGLMDLTFGLRLRRGTYRSSVEVAIGEEVSDLKGSRDLKAMVESGLVEAVGERRGRYYLAGEPLADLRKKVRASRSPKSHEDPFRLARDRRQLRLA
jgi:hypothetical protein